MYQVKCDYCKEPIRETDSVRESAEGGTCYPCARQNANSASARFRVEQLRYRQREIGDSEYLAARREYEAIERIFDAAFAAEQNK